MPREIVFLTQGFIDKGGRLIPQTAVRCKSEEAALRTARRLGETIAGAVAFSSAGDAEMGEYEEEPMVLFRIGAVPESFIE